MCRSEFAAGGEMVGACEEGCKFRRGAMRRGKGRRGCVVDLGSWIVSVPGWPGGGV